MTSRTWLAVPLVVLSLFGAGCFGSSTTTATGPDGGIWKTTDRGQDAKNWKNLRALVTGSKVTASVATFGITQMVMDPQDSQAIYAGTLANGLIYTYDGGESWQTAKAPLNVGKVNSVAVDSKNTCTVYAAAANKIYKTETCGRVWNQAFYDPRVAKSFTAVKVDWYNPTIVYAGTDAGDIFRSKDSGLTWQVVKRQEGMAVTDLVLHPKDSRILYAGTNGDGIWKTTDGGETWTTIRNQIKTEFPDARKVIRLVIDPVAPDTIYNVSKYGLIRSMDGGETWDDLTLTGAPKSIAINALAIDPKDSQKLVFTGVQTIQFSADGGKTWTPKKLPTSQVGNALLFDPNNTDTVYLGTIPAAKKSAGIGF